MDRNNHLRFFFLPAIIFAIAVALLAQDAPKKILVVNGTTVGANVVIIEGRSYVDIQSLAEGTNGSVSFGTQRILLTIPGVAPAPAPAAATTALEAAAVVTAPLQNTADLSRVFAATANGALENIREWQGALSTMVTYGLAAGGSWAQSYHDRVVTSLALATTQVTTDADHMALLLLNNDVGNLDNWANDMFARRQALNAAMTVDPNALRNNTTLAKISNCGNFLSGMIVSGVYADNGNCH